jgi:hypothetical protein
MPAKFKARRNPDSVPSRRQYPTSGYPNPAAIHPIPIAIHPNVARPRRYTDGANRDRGRRRRGRCADYDAQIYARGR